MFDDQKPMKLLQDGGDVVENMGSRVLDMKLFLYHESTELSLTWEQITAPVTSTAAKCHCPTNELFQA